MEKKRTENDRLSAARIIDAAANRAGEGLRVVEDFLRFALDDPSLTAECKRLRHELTALLAEVPSAQFLAARDTLRDLGRDITTAAEHRRDDLHSVVAASFKRSEQALRSLEEYAKLLTPDAARDFEKLRYALYTLERAAGITVDSLARLDQTRLYVLLDGRTTAEEFTALAQTLVAGGVQAIQLRDKRLDDRTLLSRGRILRDITQGTETLFIFNDRPDLAVLARADGVHVGQDELPVKECRAILGATPLIGVSTHSLAQARQAILEGANYIGVGPTFPSATKAFREFVGLELLRQVAGEIRLPTYAIGGITVENLSEALATGISRVAVSGAILNAPDPAGAIHEMKKILDRQSQDGCHR